MSGFEEAYFEEFMDATDLPMTPEDLGRYIKLALTLCGVQVESDMEAPVEEWNGMTIQAKTRVVESGFLRTITPEGLRSIICGPNGHFKLYTIEPRKGGEFKVRFAEW